MVVRSLSIEQASLIKCHVTASRGKDPGSPVEVTTRTTYPAPSQSCYPRLHNQVALHSCPPRTNDLPSTQQSSYPRLISTTFDLPCTRPGHKQLTLNSLSAHLSYPILATHRRTRLSKSPVPNHLPYTLSLRKSPRPSRQTAPQRTRIKARIGQKSNPNSNPQGPRHIRLTPHSRAETPSPQPSTPARVGGG